MRQEGEAMKLTGGEVLDVAPLSGERRGQFMDAVGNPPGVVAELCKRRLFFFLRTFWLCMSGDKPHWNWHIPYLCKELERVAERVAEGKTKEYDLIINIPPGTTKSTTVSVAFPVWCWLKWPWMRFIVASYSGILSLEHAEISRDLVRSDLFGELFPHIGIKEDKDTKSNYRIVTRDAKGNETPGGNRYSTSVGGTVTGFHAHIIITDDPLNPHQAASDIELDSTNAWFEHTLPSRRIQKSVTPTILIQQRLHQNDPTGFIMNKKENVKLICMPGEIRNFGAYLSPPELAENYVDDLMDPVRMSWDVLDELKVDLGQYGYAAQIGQNPVPPGGGMFQVGNFGIIEELPSLANVVRMVRYWDKAATADAGAYTVGAKLAKLKTGRFVVCDIVRGQWDSLKREQVMRATAEQDGKNVYIYVEQEPAGSGKESAEASIRNLAGFSVRADRPTGDKVVRADPFSVQVNNGNVDLLSGEWNKAFLDEFRWFPFGKFKDQVDATCAAFIQITGKKKAGVLLKRKRRR